MIHSTAVVAKTAKIAQNVVVGPFCVIGDNVILEEGVVLKSHVIIENNTHICKNCEIYSFATLGTHPQNINLKIRSASLIVGANAVIREYVNINAGGYDSDDNFFKTIIGSNCLIMAGSFIGHNTSIGDDVILSNNVEIANSAEIGNNAVVHSQVIIAPFVKIGEYASISVNLFLKRNVLPFGLIYKVDGQVKSELNLLAIRRFTSNEHCRKEAELIFKEIMSNDLSDPLQHIVQYKDQYRHNSILNKILHFVSLHNKNSFIESLT